MNTATHAAPTPMSSGTLTRLRWTFSDALVVAQRTLRHIPRVPERLTEVTIQPIMFGLLFAYVFGSAVTLPGGGNYREYLMAGIVVQTTAFTATSTAVGVAGDMQRGLIDRFRSLPMARSAVLVGRTFAELAQALIGIAVTAGCGLIVGWRIRDGVLPALAALGLLLLFTFAMKWIGTLTGLLVRAPEAATAISFVWIFPFTFIANTIVPTTNMPGWLRTVADWNPASALTAALRELCGNPMPPSSAWPIQHPVITSVGWSVLLIAVFMPLAIRRYRTANAR